MTFDMETAKLLAGRTALAAALIGGAWGYAWLMYDALGQMTRAHGEDCEASLAGKLRHHEGRLQRCA